MFEYSELSDEKLVEYIRTKDPEAYREIISRYHKKLARYINSITRDKNITADILQETFIKTYINLNSFSIKRKFSSWIYRIAHNETINHSQKSKREIPLSEDLEIASDENLEMNLEQKNLKEKIRECLAELPILYAEPLILFSLENKSYEEIGEILRLPTGTIGTRINRAKNLIKQICKKNKIEP